MMKILIAVGLLLLLIGTTSAENMDDVISFLAEDQTDTHEYLAWYTCGHFSRDMARNASDVNLTIGSAICGNHPMFRGYQNHIINYVDINGTMYFIEPQTDNIMELDIVFMEYKYIRLYPDGTQVPSNWRYNIVHDICTI